MVGSDNPQLGFEWASSGIKEKSTLTSLFRRCTCHLCLFSSTLLWSHVLWSPPCFWHYVSVLLPQNCWCQRETHIWDASPSLPRGPGVLSSVEWDLDQRSLGDIPPIIPPERRFGDISCGSVCVSVELSQQSIPVVVLLNQPLWSSLLPLCLSSQTPTPQNKILVIQL